MHNHTTHTHSLAQNKGLGQDKMLFFDPRGQNRDVSGSKEKYIGGQEKKLWGQKKVLGVRNRHGVKKGEPIHQLCEFKCESQSMAPHPDCLQGVPGRPQTCCQVSWCAAVSRLSVPQPLHTVLFSTPLRAASCVWARLLQSTLRHQRSL